MAKQMAFTSDDGSDHEASYWTIVQVNITLIDRQARIVFYGYRDQAAFVARRTPIGQKGYDIGIADFIAHFAGVVAGNDKLLDKVYEYAVLTEDVEDGVNEETGETLYRSFFRDAEDV